MWQRICKNKFLLGIAFVLLFSVIGVAKANGALVVQKSILQGEVVERNW